MLLRHRWLALSLVAIALLVKAVIPSGFMLTPANGAIAIVLCSGEGPEMAGMAMAVPDNPHAPRPVDGKSVDHPCAFSSLAMAATTGADAVLLALALGFALARGFLPVAARPWRGSVRLRPPLRAPPLSA